MALIFVISGAMSLSFTQFTQGEKLSLENLERLPNNEFLSPRKIVRNDSEFSLGLSDNKIEEELNTLGPLCFVHYTFTDFIPIILASVGITVAASELWKRSHSI